MFTDQPIARHAAFRFEFEELSLAEVRQGSSGFYELDVFAYGSAEIEFALDGDWRVAALSIPGRRGLTSAYLRNSHDVDLPETHALFPLIRDALDAVHHTRIQDLVWAAIGYANRCAAS